MSATLHPSTVTPPLASASRGRLVAYWIVTILGVGTFAFGGVMGIIGGEEVVKGLRDLGYPPYFAKIIGVWELLGVAAILAPRLPLLKEWAYAGFFILLTGAAATHALAGDGPAKILAPFVFLALVAASWTLRPASRRLPGI